MYVHTYLTNKADSDSDSGYGPRFFPGHGHQPAEHGGLGDDAVLLWLPLDADAVGAGEGEAQWAPVPSDLRGPGALHPQVAYTIQNIKLSFGDGV